MGRENTISTGTVGGKRLNNNYTQTSLNDNKSLPKSPFDFGIVESSNSDLSITYTPLYNNLTLTKPGIALPLFKNNTTAPPIGSIVPLLRAPSQTGIIGDVGNREIQSIYYLDPTSVNGTINSNTIGGGGGGGGLSPEEEAKLKAYAGKTAADARKTGDYQTAVLGVLTRLRERNLSKPAIAGILGNIQAESNFNVNAVYGDTNGEPSYGLIQWNRAFQKISDIGFGSVQDKRTCVNCKGTIKGQMDYLFGIATADNNNNSQYGPDYKKYETFVSNFPNESAEQYAYDFARLVERCSGCTNGRDQQVDKYYPYQDQPRYKSYRQFNKSEGEYVTYTQIKRSFYATAFLKELEDPTSPLYY